MYRHEDARKALEAARQKSFFGKKVQAEAHDGVDDSESTDVFRPPEADLDEYHHKATRTLFVGNLTKDTSKDELKAFFRRYGQILVNKPFPVRIIARYTHAHLYHKQRSQRACDDRTGVCACARATVALFEAKIERSAVVQSRFHHNHSTCVTLYSPTNHSLPDPPQKILFSQHAESTKQSICDELVS